MKTFLNCTVAVLISSFVVCYLTAIHAQQLIPISQARTTSEGSTVKVTGTVTNGSELGIIRYLQDGTAGIAAYGNQVNGVNRYDSITVTGKLKEFNGLFEIDPITNIVNHGQATTIPQPLSVPIESVGEALEGQLVTIENVTFNENGDFEGNTNYTISSGGNQLGIRINTNSNIVGTTIPSGVMSVTGLLSQFNAYQLLPRDVNDIATYTAPEKKLYVRVNGTNYLSGSTVGLGATTSATINLQNIGTGVLTINSATFSGSQASAYSTNIVAGTIGANVSTPYSITITPTTSGTQYATLTISSDDPNTPQYVLNLETSGTDGFASEPTHNPTQLNFNEIKAYKINASFTVATGSPKYIVLWKNGSPVTDTPVDGTTYQRGDQIGSSKVAYVGAGNSFSPRGIIANQTYHFAIFAFNGQNGIENYKTDDPLTGSVSSTGQNAGSYYSGISVESSSFVSNLTTLINAHTAIPYAQYTNTIVPNFYARDTFNGDSYMECQYSGQRRVYSGTFGWQAPGVLNYSREHVYARSWMPGGPYNSGNQPPDNDQHNLFPVNQDKVNAVRSNYPFGEITTVNESYLEAKLGLNSSNRKVYEPRESFKGDVARALMYMAVSYNGYNGKTWTIPDYISNSIPYGQDMDVLLKWHFQDPPDAHEIARNEYIYDLQGNRNPFIDSMHYVCYINFKNMNKQEPTADCLSGVPPTLPDPPDKDKETDSTKLELNDFDESSILVFPVPAKKILSVYSLGYKILSYELIDTRGVVVKKQTNTSADKETVTVNIEHVNAGVFFMKLNTDKGVAIKKILIE